MKKVYPKVYRVLKARTIAELEEKAGNMMYSGKWKPQGSIVIYGKSFLQAFRMRSEKELRDFNS